MKKHSKKIQLFISCFAGAAMLGCAAKHSTKTSAVSPASNNGSQIKIKDEASQNADRSLDNSNDGNYSSEISRIPLPPDSGALGPVLEDEGFDPRAPNKSLAIIHFDFDQYTLSPSAREILGDNASQITQYKDARIVIEGHCDERGTTEYNLGLGEKRASSAYKYLVDLGVESSRLKPVSYGEEKPMDEGHNENAWAQNRRVEFFAANR